MFPSNPGPQLLFNQLIFVHDRAKYSCLSICLLFSSICLSNIRSTFRTLFFLFKLRWNSRAKWNFWQLLSQPLRPMLSPQSNVMLKTLTSSKYRWGWLQWCSWALFSGNTFRTNVVEDVFPVYSAADCQAHCARWQSRGCEFFVWEAQTSQCTLLTDIGHIESDIDTNTKWMGQVRDPRTAWTDEPPRTIFRPKAAFHVSVKDGIMSKLLASTTWMDTDTLKMLKIFSNAPRSACKLATVTMLVSIQRIIDVIWRMPKDQKEFNTMVISKQHHNIVNPTHASYR